MKNAVFILAILMSGAVLAITPMSGELVNTDSNTDNMRDPNIVLVGGCNEWRCAPSCAEIHPLVKKLLSSGAECMMKLFFKESTCTAALPQKKGTAGNPHAGFGLCTLETSAALRKKRGKNCIAASPSNVTAQILCCRDIMAATSKSGSYFGPVRRGEVNKCY